MFLTLEQLKKAGLLRAYGMSTKTIEGGLLTLEHADLAMVTYNIDHTEEEAVIQYAAAHQKGILIKKAFGSGHIKNISAALDFILKNQGVSSVIVGTINPGHLEYNAQCAMGAC